MVVVVGIGLDEVLLCADVAWGLQGLSTSHILLVVSRVEEEKAGDEQGGKEDNELLGGKLEWVVVMVVGTGEGAWMVVAEANALNTTCVLGVTGVSGVRIDALEEDGVADGVVVSGGAWGWVVGIGTLGTHPGIRVGDAESVVGERGGVSIIPVVGGGFGDGGACC